MQTNRVSVATTARNSKHLDQRQEVELHDDSH
jgi:hypothetical protein